MHVAEYVARDPAQDFSLHQPRGPPIQYVLTCSRSTMLIAHVPGSFAERDGWARSARASAATLCAETSA
jgi:hypothetical protein